MKDKDFITRNAVNIVFTMVIGFGFLYMGFVLLACYIATNGPDKLEPTYYKVVITKCTDKEDTIIIYDNKFPQNKFINTYKRGIPYYYTENDKLINICGIRTISTFKTEIIMGDTIKMWVNN